jgi:dihydrolipoamide dehydrogenase
VNVGRRGVVVDDKLRTSVKTIYAAGDVAGRYLFTHSAGYEAARAIRNMFLPGSSGGEFLVPWCTFTDPELAHAGLTEAQAREQHGDQVVVGRFPFSASARAQMYGEKAGFAKTIHESRYGELLGLVIVGPQATELVNAGVVGITAEATIDTIADSITAHPTLAEAVKEAALVALGRPIHLPPPRQRAKAAAR